MNASPPIPPLSSLNSLFVILPRSKLHVSVYDPTKQWQREGPNNNNNNNNDDDDDTIYYDIIIINRFRGQNKNFARASHFFVHFFAVFAWRT